MSENEWDGFEGKESCNLDAKAARWGFQQADINARVKAAKVLGQTHFWAVHLAGSDGLIIATHVGLIVADGEEEFVGLGLDSHLRPMFRFVFAPISAEKACELVPGISYCAVEPEESHCPYAYWELKWEVVRTAFYASRKLDEACGSGDAKRSS